MLTDACNPSGFAAPPASICAASPETVAALAAVPNLDLIAAALLAVAVCLAGFRVLTMH